MQPVEDIWTCNRCGWTYPNHHPSAKHRRNHKKVCGKLPGFIIDNHHGHGDGGSSDEASSGDENSKHHEVSSAAPTETPSPEVESQSRSFDVSAALQKSETAAPDATAAVVESADDPVGVSKTTATQEVPKAEPETGSSKPEDNPKLVLKSAVPHPEEDLWICRACGWTYPNAHPSAKHRRNHKKQCGKAASAAVHANGGSSDDDSDGEHPKAAGATEKASAAEQKKAEPEPTPIVISTRDFVLESVALEQPAPAPAAVNTLKEVDATPAAPVEETAAVVEAPVTPAPSPATVSKGSAVAHPDDDIWICKECGWTYPNHHPSAKHRRNHKKQCPGKVAAASPAPGGSSDDDSDDGQHKKSQVQQAKTEAKEAASTESVSREFNLDSLAKPVVTPAVQDEKNSEETAAVLQVVQPPEISADLKSEKLAAPQKTEREIGASAVELEEAKKNEVSAAPTAPKAPSSAVAHPEEDLWKCRQCDWTYPNAHPSAKHRRNHKKHCPGEAAAASKGGSSDDDSDHETHSSASAKPTLLAATGPAEAPASASRDFQLPTADVKEQAAEAPVSRDFQSPTADVKEQAAEAPASVSRDFQSPTADVKEQASEATTPASKLEEPSGTGPAQPEEEVKTTTPPPKVGSAVPHPQDPNDLWVCKECGWTYPNAHPSAKHRRNHKKQCPGKSVAAGHTAGGSSDDDSDDGSSHRGQTSATATETAAPAEVPTVKERAMPDLGVQQTNTPSEAASPKVETRERTTVAQLVSEEQSREQEAKTKEEAKSSAVPAAPSDAPHDPNDIWVCKECGWTYPNRHPSAKHRRNHKKVCKKTNASGGGSSSDASSDDEHVGHFGKKKCFPCL